MRLWITGAVIRATRSLFLRQVAVTFFVRILGAVIALVSSIIAARTLGPEGRGVFAAASALAGIGLQFATLGLQSSNAYYLSLDRRLLKPILANSVMVSLFGGGLVAILVFLYALATDVDRNIGLFPLIWALASIPVSLCNMLFSNVLVPLGLINRFNAIDLGYRIVALLLVTATVYFGFRSPESFLAMSLLATAISLVASAAALKFSSVMLWAARPSLLVKQIPYALRAYLACLFGYVLMRIDILMVQAISGNNEAGLYSVAVALADMVYMLPAAAATLFFPRLFVSQDVAARRSLTLRMLFGTGVATALLSLMVAAMAEWIFFLFYGTDFSPATPMFRVLALAIVLFGINTIVSNFFAAQEFPWAVVGVWALGIGINVVLNIILIPSFGGIGAAWASVASYGFVLCGQLVLMLGLRLSK